MGSDFSNNDLAKSDSLIEDYTHTIDEIATIDGHRVYTVNATPRPAAPVVWGLQRLKIREDGILLQEAFFDEDLEPVKTMTTHQFGSYGTMIETAVRIRTGHFQIQAQGYQEKQQIRDVVGNPVAVAALLQRMPEVKAQTRRAQAFGLLSSQARTYGALVVDIDPENEQKASSLALLVRKGRFLEPDDTHGALIGELLARNLQVGVGDELTLLGQGRDGSVAATVLTVRGIYRSGQDDFDRGAVQMPLAAFDAAFSMRGAVHTVVGVCQRLDQIDAVRRAVTGRLPANDGKRLVFLDWQQLMPGLLQGIEMDMISSNSPGATSGATRAAPGSS